MLYTFNKRKPKLILLSYLAKLNYYPSDLFYISDFKNTIVIYIV